MFVMISLGSGRERDREVDLRSLLNTVVSVLNKGDACSCRATEYIVVEEWTRMLLHEVHVI
jgi:hypothetical protein